MEPEWGGAPLRIGLVVPDMNPIGGKGGGVAAYGRRVAEALLARGDEVHLFTRPLSGRARITSLSRAVFHFIDERAGSPRLVREVLEASGENLAWSYALCEVLIRLAPKLSLDILEGPDFAAPLYFLQLRKLADPESFPAPIVLRLHGLGREMRGYGHSAAFARGPYALDHAETFSVTAAQGLIGTSRFIRRLVCRRFGLKESRVPYIPLPLAASAKGAARRLIFPAPQRLLFIGRLEPRKGPDLLVAAALPWLELYPGLEVRFAGIDTLSRRGTSMLAYLRGLVPVKHRSRFRFLGPRSPREIEKELAACAALVVPSRFDNLPYTGLEALAAGRPLIVADACGLPEIVRHGRSGLICEPTIGSLTAALGRFLRMSGDERARMGAAGRVQTRRICSPALVARRQALFYREVIRRNERTRLPDCFPYRDLLCDGKTARPQAVPIGRPGAVSLIKGRRTAAAANEAARAASGDYLVFLQKGEKPDRCYLRDAAKALDLNPELGFVTPRAAGETPMIFEFPWSLLKPIAASAAMIRRAAFEAAGGFADDRDLLVSIGERGWGGIPLVVPGSVESDGGLRLLGHPRLRRRFRSDLVHLRAAESARMKTTPIDMTKAFLALDLWKESLGRLYD